MSSKDFPIDFFIESILFFALFISFAAILIPSISDFMFFFVTEITSSNYF